ncbi:MAG: hypothetical protein O3B73_16500 [bacterium]|nr:hypothetical protein [bacterium]
MADLLLETRTEVPIFSIVACFPTCADGTPWSNTDLRFAQSIAGLNPEYNWRATTNFLGVAVIQIILAPDPLNKRGANGYYQVIAINRRTGAQVGSWNNAGIRGDKLITMTLNIDGAADVTNRQFLETTAFALTKPVQSADADHLPASRSR